MLLYPVAIHKWPPANFFLLLSKIESKAFIRIQSWLPCRVFHGVVQDFCCFLGSASLNQVLILFPSQNSWCSSALLCHAKLWLSIQYTELRYARGGELIFWIISAIHQRSFCSNAQLTAIRKHEWLKENAAFNLAFTNQLSSVMVPISTHHLESTK